MVLGTSETPFPKGPLQEHDMRYALLKDKDPDDNCWEVAIPEGASAEAVMDQLVKFGYTPTRVKLRKVFFGKK